MTASGVSGIRSGVGARELSARYPVWLCDIWGVVHNGLTAYPAATDALLRHRAGGGAVVLITNAPRLSRDVRRQLERMRVGPDVFDAIVTSGDLTRSLIAGRAGRAVHYIGPRRDLTLFEDLDVTLVPLADADVVVCTGLIDDLNERPDHYDPVLARMRERGLDMICANPDKVVRRGDQLLPCAGALAERYEALGGRVLMAGKPFAPIYEACLRTASDAAERAVDRREVLAIGDGLATDVTGAARNGLALLFIAGGIHEAELDGDVAAVVRRATPGIDLVAALPALRW